METCIKAESITKRYGTHVVVDHVSLEVKKGIFYGLLGPNGAGKSTLIDCLLGIHKPEEGECELLGKRVETHRRELFTRIGVQLQHSHYQNNIKVYEVCEEMSALYQHPQDYRDLLKQFHLFELAHQFVSELSGGERQKLSIVIALLCRPEMIFLDELTTGLDVVARREVWQMLLTLKQQGLTVFLTTHYMEEAEKLCDEIMIIKDGKRVVAGSVQDIVAQSPYTQLEEAYLWYIGEESFV